MKYFYMTLIVLSVINGQTVDIEQHRKLTFPDIPGFLTLKCDLHQHTVFSDGHVWPSIRVQEAQKDDLDAIAVTEHLEYQPHKQDIPHPDRNRAYEIEKDIAKDQLIIISGSEITRSLPPGHSNAIFLKDANKLLLDDPIAAFREARHQGAFIFWNHPHWTGQKKDAIAQLTDMHEMLLKENLLDGIEVVNELTYSDEALQIALDYDLTIMGTSDVHGLVDWDYDVPQGGHRPITLVFAKEKSEESIREALFDKRTVVFFKNLLIGRSDYLVPLIKSSLSIKDMKYSDDTTVLKVILNNASSAEFILQNSSKYTFYDFADVITIKPLSDLEINVKTVSRLDDISLSLKVLNAINAPATHPDLILKGQID